MDGQKRTPPQLARQLGVAPETVIGWIRSGELRAIDVSSRPGVGRPRFRIDVADLAVFEQRRAVVPQVKTSRRRRRRTPGIVEFF